MVGSSSTIKMFITAVSRATTASSVVLAWIVLEAPTSRAPVVPFQEPGNALAIQDGISILLYI
jgi:hypothetical protein